MNSGYVGHSRSVRSQQAIENFEVPITLIKKDLVLNFLKEHGDEFNSSDKEFLKKLSILKWKFVARSMVSPSSWHHTSNRFNKTDHYDLFDVANKAIEVKSDIDSLYQNSVTEKINYKFGVAEIQVWGGSRKYPRLLGTEVVAGIISGDWLHCRVNHKKEGLFTKHKVSANKIEWLKEYDTYDDLVNKHKEFKNTKRVFNSIVKKK